MAASPRNRVFKQALLASLALHAALLLGVPELRPAMTQAVESVPLIARLLDLQPAAAPQARQEEKERERKPEKKQEEKRVEPVAAATPAIPPVATPEPAARPAPAAPVQAPPTSSVPPSPAPAAARAETAETLSTDQYRLELLATANRIKDRMRYPPQAKDNLWEGDVRLGVAISASGRPSISLTRSSRYEVLDLQAQEILRLALREVALPPALQGRESTLKELTFEYRLKAKD